VGEEKLSEEQATRLNFLLERCSKTYRPTAQGRQCGSNTSTTLDAASGFEPEYGALQASALRAAPCLGMSSQFGPTVRI
jgi:hypothetical protein